MVTNTWRPSRPYPDQSRKRPYSPHPSPSRATRLRNAIHRDVLFEQGPIPLFAQFSSRGSRAVCCFRNGFLRVWNVDPVHDRFLDCEQVLRHPETVFRAAISDDGTRAVTTAGDGVARVWELQSTQPRVNTIVSQYRSTRTCDITSDGQFIVATFYSGRRQPTSHFRGLVVLYQPQTDMYRSRISVHGVPDKVKISRDATTIAVGCYGVKPAKNMARDNRITIFNRDGTEIVQFNNCFRDHDSCLAWDFSEDGQVLAICAHNRSAIHVYINRDERTWRDPPLLLSANAELTYETCRIVDNGDLVTAVALDNHTEERSVLVFRPHTGDVLFSLACGLIDQRACLDLEPRVCFVAPTLDGPGRKVVRLIAKTPGDNGNTVELVRCGDPPKSVLHGPNKSFDSTPPTLCDNTCQPTNLRVPPKPGGATQVASILQDTNPPTSNSTDWSPARGSSQSIKTNSLPHDNNSNRPEKTNALPYDDRFKLRKAITKDKTVNRLSPLQSFPVVSPLLSPKNVTPKKRTLQSLGDGVPTKEVQASKKPVPAPESSDSKQSSANKLTPEKEIPHSPEPIVPNKKTPNSAKAAPSETKQCSASQGLDKGPENLPNNLQVSEKAQQVPNVVLSPISTVCASGEVDPENTQKFRKSTILSKSTLPTNPTQGSEQTFTRTEETESFIKQQEQAIVQNTPNDRDAQALTDKTQKAPNGASTQALSNAKQRATNSSRAQSVSNKQQKPPNTSDAQALSNKKQKTPHSFDSQALSNRQEKVPDMQAPSSKQFGTTEQVNEKKNNETNKLLQVTAKNHHSDDTKQGTALPKGAITEQKRSDANLEMNKAPVPNPKKPRWQRTRLLASRKKKRANAALESKEDRMVASTGPESIKHGKLGLSRQIESKLDHETNLNSDQNSQGMNTSSESKPSKPPRSQDSSTSSPLEMSISSGQLEISKKLRDAEKGGEANINSTTIVTVSNLVPSSYDTLVQTPESQRKNSVESGTKESNMRHNLKNEMMVNLTMSNQEASGRSPDSCQDGILTGATAKPEMVLGQSNINASPTMMASPDSTPLDSKKSSSPELKTDPNETHYKNRYFGALQRAKVLFRGASHKIEGGDQVLSNVKAFKTMLQVVAAESELLDRRTVAKTVYAKGGINNTLNETQFLEAFCHVYDQLQGVRQHQWSEVYNRAAAGEGDGILMFHARDLIKQESETLKLSLNPIWTDEALDELIASQAADDVFVSQDAFVQSTDKIFSI